MAYKQTTLIDAPYQQNRQALIPKIGGSYTDTSDLLKIVTLFNDWQFETGLYALDKIIEAGLNRVDALLLKGETLALAEENREALSVYTEVLEVEPDNVYALTGKLIQLDRIKAEEQIRNNCAQPLRTITPKLYQKYTSVRSFMTEHQNAFEKKCDSRAIDALMVYGYFLNPDGSFPEKLRTRLDKVLDLAERYPDAAIVISGGAVQNHHTEATVMKQFLVIKGIDHKRVFAYTQARDTVGNIIEFLDYSREQSVKNVCAVTSKDHLPRAWMSLVIGFKEAGQDVNVYGESPEDDLDAAMIEKEHNLNYQTLFRLAGLFEKKDIRKLIE